MTTANGTEQFALGRTTDSGTMVVC